MTAVFIPAGQATFASDQQLTAPHLGQLERSLRRRRSHGFDSGEANRAAPTPVVFSLPARVPLTASTPL